MPKNKKKFIDKKKAVTFHLVHRSQQDPLIADENAPQHVLVAAQQSTASNESKAHKEQQRLFGIYYDDDYDYLQHLRDRIAPINDWQQTETPTKTKIKLPSSVFASNVKEEIGLLNKAAPQGLRLDVDPDVVAAMDDDFDYGNPDNFLEDDFIQMADGVASDVEDDQDDGSYYYRDDDNRSDHCWNSDEENDVVGSLDEDVRSTKSRFTEYSMSSSVVRRNEQLTILDDKFEQMFASYDETEIGALELEEIEGEVDTQSELVKQFAEEFEKEQAKESFKQDRHAIAYMECNSDDNSGDEMAPLDRIEVNKNQKWDCESILSTNSNLYNHPKLIVEPPKIRLDKRGIPIINQRLTAKSLAQLADCKPSTGPGSLASAISTLSIRPKCETTEQRKQRKNALKEHRKERRIERKINTAAFKEEKKKMEKL